MEKNQYELCLEVLRRLNRAGVLNDIMLIGSWCLPFYREYFFDRVSSDLIRRTETLMDMTLENEPLFHDSYRHRLSRYSVPKLGNKQLQCDRP